MAATESGLRTTLSSSRVAGRAELVGPGTTLAEERLLPVVPALEPLLPRRGLRRGTTVTVTRSAALALVPVAGARAWPAVVAAFLDAVDVVLVRSPPRLPAAQARRLAARARERGAVLVPIGAWSQPADLRLAVTSSTWQGLGQGHGHLRARQAEVSISGRGTATREHRFLLWLPSPDGTITLMEPPAQTGSGDPAGPTLAGEGDAPAGEGRPPLADAG